MSSHPTRTDPEERARRFTTPASLLAGGGLLYLAVSGLAIRYLPFSASNQWQVLVHTVAGVLFLLPIGIYSIRHLRQYATRALTPLVVTGWVSGLATLVALVTGGILGWQAFFGTRISYGMSLTHLVATFPFLAFALHHVVAILLRVRRAVVREGARELAPVRAAGRRWHHVASGTAGLLLVAPLFLSLVVPQRKLDHRFPDDYTTPFGPARPFAPSLAKTSTGGAFDEATLAGSESCGTSGCHEAITNEWRVSAHRWASMDAGFQRIQEEMAKQNGPESTRYCGGCHDPISLFAGTKNLFTEKLSSLPGYQEGIGCLVCHSLRETDVKGNAAYVVEEPPRYLFESRAVPASLGGRFAKLSSDFLIRAYPKEHARRLSRKLFKTPEFCAACHKQFIDQEVNKVGWVQLQNQYDNWRKSKWNHPGDPKSTIECRECHMPLAVGTEPASGDSLDYNRAADDGRYRSHRFLAANQFMPAALKIPGAEEQIRLTEKWLRGELAIPEIESKWARGPAVPIRLEVPGTAKAGEELPLAVLITSNKVGHDFPTGPLDIIQAWVDLSVTDGSGTEVFRSGRVDPANHFIDPGAFLFKAEPVDREGNLIDRHNLWEMVGVRYRRALFPGFSDRAEYRFPCPGAVAPPEPRGDRREEHAFTTPEGTRGPLTVTATLRYRKIDQYLLNFLFGPEAGLTAPVTDLSTATATIEVAPPAVAEGDRRPRTRAVPGG